MSRHLYIEGRVQGVGYRASFAALANSLGLSGWVRNRQDGAVEALVSGSDEALERLLTWAHQGPPAAQVTRIRVTDSEEAGLPARVEIRPTA